MWRRVGGAIGFLALLGLVVALAQLVHAIEAGNAQLSAQATENALLQRQLDVQREIATLQAGDSVAGPAATAAATRVSELESTAVALATAHAEAEAGVVRTGQPRVETPLRDHQTVSIGTGVFAEATFSDGMAPYDEGWLWANDHFNIQRIRREENPDGCGSVQYQVDRIWIGVGAIAKVTVNGAEIGTVTTITPLQRHGYIVGVHLDVGDVVCVSPIPQSGYHIILGPDVYYHHDTYCYRGNC
jgi:hypothetical protein